MYRRLLFILALTLWGCERENKTEWHAREYLGKVCEACPSVRVGIPEAGDNTPLGRGVNQALREEVIEILDYDETRNATAIPEAIEAFSTAYRELRRQFPDETIGWEAELEGQITYEDDRLLSVKLESYVFTGGAHGLLTIRYLNFDKKTGEELGAEALFADLTALENMAEKAFREAKGIPSGAGINDTGFMFEEDRFALPENLGFTPQGLELLYNPYEVASYADGPVSLVLPMESIAPMLASRLQPRQGP